LELTPRKHEATARIDSGNSVIGRHFARLAKATNARQVIPAGRTMEAIEQSFGLVIFEAERADAASLFGESDPAIEANLMSATLQPHSVALYRKIRQ
jgi:uncharacterized protein YciI